MLCYTLPALLGRLKSQAVGQGGQLFVASALSKVAWPRPSMQLGGDYNRIQQY